LNGSPAEASPGRARRAVRAAAVVLALVAAWLLAGIAQDDPWAAPPLATLVKALAVTSVLQAGLFWSATAKGIGRLFAGLLMVPTALILAGMIGEAVTRAARGYPLNVLAVAVSLGGEFLYFWQFLSLARRSK
jgi:hypothetical protein